MKSLVIHLVIGIAIIVFTIYGAFVLPEQVRMALDNDRPISAHKNLIYEFATRYGWLLLSISLYSFIIGSTCKTGPKIKWGWIGSTLILFISYLIAITSNPVVFVLGWLLSIFFIIFVGRGVRIKVNMTNDFKKEL